MLFKSIYFRRTEDSKSEFGLEISHYTEKCTIAKSITIDCMGNLVEDKPYDYGYLDETSVAYTRHSEEQENNLGVDIDLVVNRDTLPICKEDEPLRYRLKVQSIMYYSKGSKDAQHGLCIRSTDTVENKLVNAIILDDNCDLVKDTETSIKVLIDLSFCIICGKNVF